MSATDRINALGAWIDRGLEWDDAEGIDRSNEAKLMHRTVKIGEEYGVTATDVRPVPPAGRRLIAPCGCLGGGDITICLLYTSRCV